MTHLLVNEIAQRLHQEHLFIESEKSHMKELHKCTSVYAKELVHIFWNTRLQHLQLNEMSSASSDAMFTATKQHLWMWESMRFVDGCSCLQYHEESSYSHLLQSLILNPPFVASCLLIGSELDLSETNDVAYTIMLCCYGSDFITDDYSNVIKIMDMLYMQHFAYKKKIDDLQNNNSLFSSVFKMIVDFLLDGKHFLASALCQPVTEIVRKNILFLETNPKKLITRLTPDEINQIFGSPEDPSFQKAIQGHVGRNEIILFDFCISILSSLFATLTAFPPCLGWIIARIYDVLTGIGELTDVEAYAFCADLLLTQFICPAIVNPELYGVIEDVIISSQCRFNLTQIVQTLQAASRSRTTVQCTALQSQLWESLQKFVKMIVEFFSAHKPPARESSSSWKNCGVLITPSRLTQLVRFLRNLQRSEAIYLDHVTLHNILSTVPDQLPFCMQSITHINIHLAPEASNNLVNGERSHSSSAASSIADIAGDFATGQRTPRKSRIPMSPFRSVDNRSPIEDELVLVIPLQREDEEFEVSSEAEFMKSLETSTRTTSTSKQGEDCGIIDSSSSSSAPSSFNSQGETEEATEAAGSGIMNSVASTHSAGIRNSRTPATELLEIKQIPLIRSRFESVVNIDHERGSTSDDVISRKSPVDKSAVFRIKEGKSSNRGTTDRRSTYSDMWSDDVRPRDRARSLSVHSLLSTIVSSLPSDNADFLQAITSSVGTDTSRANCDVGDSPVSIEPSLEASNEIDQWMLDNDSSEAEEKSMSKAGRLLGVSLTEAGESAIESASSLWKAERLLGVKLSHDEGKMATIRKNRFHSTSSPQRRLTESRSLWRSLTKLSVSNPVSHLSGTINADHTDRRYSLAQMSKGDEVIQKYREIHASKRCKHNSCSDIAWSVAERDEKKLREVDHQDIRDTASIRDITSSSTSLLSDFDAATSAHKSTSSSPQLTSMPAFNSTRKGYVEKNFRDICSTMDPPSTSYTSSLTYCMMDLTSAPDSTGSLRHQLLSLLRFYSSRTRYSRDDRKYLLVADTMQHLAEADDDRCTGIIENMWTEYQRRSTYIAYLVRAKQQLLASLSFLRSAIASLQQEKTTMRRHYISLCVSFFLKQKESAMTKFEEQFEEVAADEKASLMRTFLNDLYAEIVETCNWKDLDCADLEKTDLLIELHVFTRVHTAAMFPNGDADIERDEVFQRLISILSQTVTPQHPSILIPEKFMIGHPWLLAQEEIKALSVYVSPKTKIQAVVRCCKAILALLELADTKHTPSADDIFPVLAFVLIKANPPHLLSTRDFINNFFEDQLHGLEGYLWATFECAVLLLKEMSAS